MKHKIGDIWITGSGETNIKTNTGKTQSYHRFLVEEYFGFQIPNGYVIHHIDFNHLNNTLSNFLIIPTALHIWIHRTKTNYLSSNLEVFKNLYTNTK